MSVTKLNSAKCRSCNVVDRSSIDSVSRSLVGRPQPSSELLRPTSVVIVVVAPLNWQPATTRRTRRW